MRFCGSGLMAIRARPFGIWTSQSIGSFNSVTSGLASAWDQQQNMQSCCLTLGVAAWMNPSMNLLRATSAYRGFTCFAECSYLASNTHSPQWTAPTSHATTISRIRHLARWLTAGMAHNAQRAGKLALNKWISLYERIHRFGCICSNNTNSKLDDWQRRPVHPRRTLPDSSRVWPHGPFWRADDWRGLSPA